MKEKKKKKRSFAEKSHFEANKMTKGRLCQMKVTTVAFMQSREQRFVYAHVWHVNVAAIQDSSSSQRLSYSRDDNRQLQSAIARVKR